MSSENFWQKTILYQYSLYKKKKKRHIDSKIPLPARLLDKSYSWSFNDVVILNLGITCLLNNWPQYFYLINAKFKQVFKILLFLIRLQ